MNGFSCGSIAELELDRNGSRECSKKVWFCALESNLARGNESVLERHKASAGLWTEISESCLAEERNDLSKKQIRKMHRTKALLSHSTRKMALPCARFPSSRVTI